MSSSQPRGLHNFISELRNAKSKEEETQRVDKELANIRKKFTGSSSLSSYQRKKYVWKLVYIFMLGYDVDFGHSEVITLVASGKYSEKQVGYVALSLLLKGGDQMLSLVINSIRNDLLHPTQQLKDVAQSLALCSIANVSGLELCQALHNDVRQILLADDTTPCVKKKAALCLLRLIRTLPDVIQAKEFSPHIGRLLSNRHLGVLTSTMSLLLGLATVHTKEYENIVPIAVHILGLLVLKGSCSADYLYYRTPSPWLQIKLLKFLQFYPNIMTKGGETHVAQLQAIVSKILTETDVSDSINKSNADHAILFEAVNLIVIWGAAGPTALRDGAMRLLGKFISVREPNIRYLGLMTMARLAQLEGSAESVKKHQATVLVSLKDADISVRRRALDLLFVMCDTDNAEKIVNELVVYLTVADAAIREEMVLKIAILAEKYATDLKWYVDTILKLISISGDHVSDSIWHRVVQIVTNNPAGDLQSYAAATLFVTVASKRAHETAVKVSAYILGEFGFLIAEQPGMSGEEQFGVLHQHWPVVGRMTKAILISTYAKLANLYEECRPLVTPVFNKNRNAVDVEIQQRSNEYRVMREAFSPEAVEDLLREMPPFEDKKQSALEMRLREKEQETNDKNVWLNDGSTDTGKNNSKNVKQESERVVENSLANGNGSLPVNGEQHDYIDEAPLPNIPQSVAADVTTRDTIPPSSSSTPSSSTDSLHNNRPVGIPKEVIPAMRKAFSNLCISSSGVLFENQLLQVGVKHEYRGSQGRISIFFGNLSPSPLTHFQCKLSEAEYFRSQMQGTEGILKEQGCTVAVKTQAKLLMMIEAAAPFDDAPTMRVSFESEGQMYDYPLRLPIVATCFMEPVSLDPGAFMNRWKSLEGQDRECQEVVKASPSSPVTEETMAKIAGIVTNGLHFSRCLGCDPTPWTVSGAATFRTGAMDANGNNINVGCLIRVEANPQAGAYRVTTRTLHPLCSKAVKNVALVNIRLA
mmetsp:Transcript_20307/g.46068  ORF Transcript_20307/g.46068 Transcript_20307/m.46068 type:complete len:985 (-) Transcript_20307:533-3487(-)